MPTINLELALTTPPVGMNLFVIEGITGALLGQIIRGAVPPNVLLPILGLFIVWAFPWLSLPQLSLWQPRTSGIGR